MKGCVKGCVRGLISGGKRGIHDMGDGKRGE